MPRKSTKPIQGQQLELDFLGAAPAEDPAIAELQAQLNELKIYGSARWSWHPGQQLPWTRETGEVGAFLSPDIKHWGLGISTAQWLCHWWKVYERTRPCFDWAMQPPGNMFKTETLCKPENPDPDDRELTPF